MSDDLAKRVDSLVVLLNMERKKSLSLGKHIEKLEAALREIETLELDPRNSGQTWVEALRQIARKALEGKDD